jgi:hypothetical protein
MLLLLAQLAALSETGRIVTPTNYGRLASEGNSTLYAVKTASPTDYVSGDVQLLDLHGTRHEQGYAYGKLGGSAALHNYNALLGSLIDTKSLLGKLEQAALEVVVDWQWKSALSKQVPSEMAEELAGFAEGCKAALPLHKSFCERGAGRFQTLANLPGDLSDIIFVLLDELPHAVIAEAEALLARTGQPRSLRGFLGGLPWPLAQCSMLAVWGNRTLGGGVLSGRNLDWNHDTGINQYKLVAVFHPPEPGRHAHATFGFGGLIGALAGMSSVGLTTHEANLESNRDSFRGFPWLLRLRYILERANSLSEAKTLWLATNNTVGVNHMVASASDASAIVIETNAASSAFFSADDPRERAAAFPGPGGRIIRGAPMKQALFRTNHGFASEIVSHYMWNSTSAYNDSDYRYHLIANRLRAYEQAGVQVNATGAVHLTSLAAQKGPDYLVCAPPYGPDHGENVLSVATDPTTLVAYAAWEDGKGFGSAPGNWKPAGCAPYLEIDLKPWF